MYVKLNLIKNESEMIKLADKVPAEYSAFVGPDSLRATTQLLKNLYDLHTKRYCGYEDINGSQYEGTVENWGSEMLLEARKILLNKPSLKNIFIENTLDFYFDIQYSEFINTYNQENMLCAVLRKDVLLSNREYVIRFSDSDIIRVPRAQSSSDPKVFVDEFIHTTTPPVLVITKEDGSEEELELRLTDVTGNNTEYYFHLGIETEDMVPSSLIDDGTFTTLPITDSMNGRACLWMCIDLLRTLPRIQIDNNVFESEIFFTVGTNGHDISKAYALFNNKLEDVPDIGKWLVKIIPIESESFVNNEKYANNYTTEIQEIHLLYYDRSSWDEIDPGIMPDTEIRITYDHSYIKMSLSEFTCNNIIKQEDGTTPVPYEGKWYFKTPKDGDYDYDGRLYKNKCYAYTNLGSFAENCIDYDSSTQCVPMLTIKFDDSYLHKYEGLCENAYSGIHVDTTSDLSNNGVSKKNGVIHDMGDFDGLPPYFKYMIDDTIHRAHVEMYAIRDKLNDVNQLPMDKQTAGIIIDTAIPQNEIQKVTDTLPVVIYFDWYDQINRKYKYDETIESASKTNYLSEITYVDDYKFGNSKMALYQNNEKFVYHGNRRFSLGMMGFDPELETGRVYIVSNDKAVYENNEETTNPKAPLTFARICDIPTSYNQLVNIKNVAPTLVIDVSYVRTEASYDTADKNVSYNITNKDHIIWQPGYIVYPAWYDVEASMEAIRYPKYSRLNELIDLSNSDNISFDINDDSEGYAVDDTFQFYVGGICIKGIVDEVDGGKVTKVSYLSYDDNGELIKTDYPNLSYSKTVRSNFTHRESSFETESTKGTGTNLFIRITISDSLWNSTNVIDVGYADDEFYLMKDYDGSIWAFVKESNAFVQDSQISGIDIYKNIYDSGDTITTRDAFIYNMINPISNELTSVDVNGIVTISNVRKDSGYDIYSSDLTEFLNRNNTNVQSGIFAFDEGYVTSNYNNLLRYENGHIESSQNDFMKPEYSDLCFSSYPNKTNKIRYHSYDDNTQPSLYLFDPTADTIEIHDTVSKDIVLLKDSKDLVITDIFNATSITPNNMVDKAGILDRNVYIFNEFDTSEMDTKRETYNKYTRDALAVIMKRDFPDSYPLRFEGTDYAFSKEMLIDYMMENTIYRGRNALYTDGPESIYRRPEIKLFRQKGEQVVDRAGRPLGEQPKGQFKEITTEVFNGNVKLDSKNSVALPIFVFRIDTDDEAASLNGFRMYDDMGNDISAYTLLILNGELYVANVTRTSVEWVKVVRNNKEEEEDE